MDYKAKISEHQVTYRDALLAEFLCYQASRIQGRGHLARNDPMDARQANGRHSQLRLPTLRAHTGWAQRQEKGERLCERQVSFHAWGVYLIRERHATSAKNKRENSWRGSPLELRPGF